MKLGRKNTEYSKKEKLCIFKSHEFINFENTKNYFHKDDDFLNFKDIFRKSTINYKKNIKSKKFANLNMITEKEIRKIEDKTLNIEEKKNYEKFFTNK